MCLEAFADGRFRAKRHLVAGEPVLGLSERTGLMLCKLSVLGLSVSTRFWHKFLELVGS